MYIYKTNKGYKFNSYDSAELKAKSKKQRQTWFDLLTPDEQQKYIEYKNERKQIKRREDGYIEPFKGGTDTKNCTICVHGKSNSCQDKKNQDYICRSYFNMNTDF